MNNIPSGTIADLSLEHAKRHGSPMGLLPEPIELAVEAIVADIAGSSIGRAWERIDPEKQRDIKYIWGLIIEKALDTDPQSVVE